MSMTFTALAFSTLITVPSASQTDASSIPILVSSDASGSSHPAAISENAKKLFSYLEAETRVRFVVQPMPWKRALVLAQQGQGFLYGASKNAERLAVLKFSEPIYYDTVWLVKRCDSPLKYAQLSDLRDQSIGVVRGSTYGEEFDSAANIIFKAELDANNNRSRFAKLLRKRTDALVIYSQAQSSALLENDLNQRYGTLATTESGDMRRHPFCVLPKSVSTRSVHFAFAPGYNDRFLERLNAALIKAKASGDLGKIYSGILPQ